MPDIPSLLGPDFYGFVLPFIFVFAVVYGLLTKTTVFGKNDRISAILAVVMAFFVTAVGGPALSSFFINLFGGASFFLAGILVIILLLVMVGKQDVLNKTIFAIAVIALGVFLFLSSSAGGFIGLTIDSSTATLIFALIVLAVAVYWITRPESAATPPPTKQA